MNINRLCTLGYENDCKSVFLSWNTTPASDEFRFVMDQLIDGMADRNTGKILTDTTNMGAISAEDEQWSVTDWLERALRVGYRSLAILLPNEIFTQLKVNEVVAQTEGADPVTVQYFSDLSDARKWLKAQ